jgi:general secretion pathway protein D
MKSMKMRGVQFIVVCMMALGLTNTAVAEDCSTKLFSVTIDSKLTIGDVIDTLQIHAVLLLSLKMRLQENA